MTREEHIEQLELMLRCPEYNLDDNDRETIKVCIKALEQQPCIQEKQANADAVYIDGFKAGYSQARFDLEQELCDDCISREAMHIELEKWITYGEHKYSNATKYLYDRIDRLPPVTPEQRTGQWIPVSERLPEKSGLYLISIGDLVTSKSFDGHNFRTDSAIRFIPDAWMPLPEPYKAESEVKE